jgi:hypothetical protein
MGMHQQMNPHMNVPQMQQRMPGNDQMGQKPMMDANDNRNLPMQHNSHPHGQFPHNMNGNGAPGMPHQRPPQLNRGPDPKKNMGRKPTTGDNKRPNPSKSPGIKRTKEIIYVKLFAV